MSAIRVVGVGLLISWLGALPLGVLNITAFDISATQGVLAAVLFAISAIIVELFYVRLSLWGNKKWILNEQWIAPLLLLGVLVLLYLSVSSFFGSAATSSLAYKEEWLGVGSPMLLGFLLSAINPLQFPFWLTWNKVLSNKNILRETTESYSWYMLGIGLGSFLALGLFIWFGNSFGVNYYETYGYYSNTILGAIYLGFSLYLLFLFYKRSLKPVVK